MAFPSVSNVTTTAFGLATTSHLVTMPPVVAAGDLLIALTCFKEISGITTPAGWTEFTDTPNTSIELGIHAKEADGTEDGTTVDFATPANSCRGAAIVYRIVDWRSGSTLTEDVNVGVPETVSLTQPDPPSLDPANWGTEDTLWIVVAARNRNSDESLLSYPAGYSNGQYVESSSGTEQSIHCCIVSAQRNNATGTENPGAFNIGSTVRNAVSNTIAIRPVGTPTPFPPPPRVHTGAYYNVTRFTR